MTHQQWLTSTITVTTSMKDSGWEIKEGEEMMSSETRLGHNRQTANTDGDRWRMNNRLMKASLSSSPWLFFVPAPPSTPLSFLQPSLRSDSPRPLTSGSPHFMGSACVHSYLSSYLRALFPPLFCSASFPSFLSHPFISVVLPPHPASFLPLSSLPMANRCLNKVSLGSREKLSWLVGPSRSRLRAPTYTLAHLRWGTHQHTHWSLCCVLLWSPKNIKKSSLGLETEPDVIKVQWRTNRRDFTILLFLFFLSRALYLEPTQRNSRAFVMIIKKRSRKQDRREMSQQWNLVSFPPFLFLY